MKTPTMSPLTVPRSALVPVLALLLAGCAATTQLGAQYVDPQLPKQALRGATVLVVCEAGEPAIKLICENQVSAQLVALGARPVTDATLVNPTPGREPPAGQYLPAAKAAGAKAVFSTTLAPDFSAASAGPSFSIGIGGFGGSGGGYRGGTSVGGGVGLSVPVGGGPPGSGVAGIGSVVDAATGRVMWTARATTPPGPDVTAQIAEVSNALTDAAKQSGLF